MAKPNEDELKRIIKLKEEVEKRGSSQNSKSTILKKELLDEEGNIISYRLPGRGAGDHNALSESNNKKSSSDSIEQNGCFTQPDIQVPQTQTPVSVILEAGFKDEADITEISPLPSEEISTESFDSKNDEFREQVLEDLNTFLLKEDNELFFNERDFQMHLSLYLRHTGHYDDVDIEYFIPFSIFGDQYIWENQLYLDIVLRKDDLYIPIELKYPTRRVVRKINRFGVFLPDEVEIVKNQGAQNFVAYNFWKDVRRLELVKNEFKNVKTGFAIMLTNDNAYQQPRRAGANSEEMSIAEGEHGLTRFWHRPPAGTKGKDKDNFTLDKCYNIRWNDASPLEGEPFKYTIVEV